MRKDSRERAQPKSAVARDRDVMFALLDGGQAQVAAGLTGHVVTEDPKRVGEVVPERSRGSLILRWSRPSRSEAG